MTVSDGDVWDDHLTFSVTFPVSEKWVVDDVCVTVETRVGLFSPSLCSRLLFCLFLDGISRSSTAQSIFQGKNVHREMSKKIRYYEREPCKDSGTLWMTKRNSRNADWLIWRKLTTYFNCWLRVRIDTNEPKEYDSWFNTSCTTIGGNSQTGTEVVIIW